MAANVESMFYVRETPWHGLGTKVLEAPASKDALQLAGLNWRVMQEPIYTAREELVDGYKANVRDSDRKVLGVVTDRYRVIQNDEAGFFFFFFYEHKNSFNSLSVKSINPSLFKITLWASNKIVRLFLSFFILYSVAPLTLSLLLYFS